MLRDGLRMRKECTFLCPYGLCARIFYDTLCGMARKKSCEEVLQTSFNSAVYIDTNVTSCTLWCMSCVGLICMDEEINFEQSSASRSQMSNEL